MHAEALHIHLSSELVSRYRGRRNGTCCRNRTQAFDCLARFKHPKIGENTHQCRAKRFFDHRGFKEAEGSQDWPFRSSCSVGKPSLPVFRAGDFRCQGDPDKSVSFPPSHGCQVQTRQQSSHIAGTKSPFAGTCPASPRRAVSRIPAEEFRYRLCVDLPHRPWYTFHPQSQTSRRPSPNR